MRDIGANIRRARTRRHLTQDDLAQTVHTTRQTISNYETGRSRPDVETLQRLADALGVELTELLDETPPAAVRRAALRRLCITGAVTLVLTGLWAYLHAVCLRQYQRGDMVPLAAMLITEPLLLCALAWTLLQALRMVTRLRPRRGAPWVYPLVWALFSLCLAILVVSVVLPAAGCDAAAVVQRPQHHGGAVFPPRRAALADAAGHRAVKLHKGSRAEARFCRFFAGFGEKCPRPLAICGRAWYIVLARKTPVRYTRAIFPQNQK